VTAAKLRLVGRGGRLAPLAFISQVLTPVVLVFAAVAQGTMSNIEEPRQVVVRTAGEWQALWKEHDPESGAPSVDFTQSIVVAVFLGSRPTAGFAVEVTAVKAEGNRTVVEYLERQPPRGASVAQVLTSPFHAVRVTRMVGPVEFRRLSP
jgi:hypothetical protein